MNNEHTDWEVFAGRLITSFGEIELLTHRLFRLWLPQKSGHEYTLLQRLDKLIGYVDHLTDQGDKKQRLVDLLIECRKLNVIRNQVAHNPTILTKFDETTYENEITDLRGDRDPISLEQLHEYADEAVSVKSELFITVSQYANEPINNLIA
ncbi:MAG: hypothetical protein ACFFDP_08785 [Promethearchaeota archaeon]